MEVCVLKANLIINIYEFIQSGQKKPNLLATSRITFPKRALRVHVISAYSQMQFGLEERLVELPRQRLEPI